MRSALALSCALAVRPAAASDATIWTVGEPDGRPAGFALAPDGFRDFLARDFGYEDKFYLVGHSDPATDFPYVLPGPADTWGGTWPTSGWRTHEVNILFGLDGQPEGDCLLTDRMPGSGSMIPMTRLLPAAVTASRSRPSIRFR